MGWYGPNCQEECACEHTCPCDRETGSCNITYHRAVQEQLNKGTSEHKACAFKQTLEEQLWRIMFCLLGYHLTPARSFSVRFYTFLPTAAFLPSILLFSSRAVFGFPE